MAGPARNHAFVLKAQAGAALACLRPVAQSET